MQASPEMNVSGGAAVSVFLCLPPVITAFSSEWNNLSKCQESQESLEMKVTSKPEPAVKG